MSIEKCIDDAFEAGKGLVGRDRIRQLITEIGQKKLEGTDLTDMTNELTELFENLELVSLQRRKNALRDKVLRKEAVERIMEDINDTTAPTAVNIMLKKVGLFNEKKARLKAAYENYFRVGNDYIQGIADESKNIISIELDKAELTDFALSGVNDADITREIHAITSDLTRNKSITGNDQAFQVAKIIQTELQNLHGRKVAAGSAIQFKKGFITSNMWDDAKFAKMTDDEFFDLVKDLQWGGSKRSKKDWLEFKEKVQARDFTDIEDYLNGHAEGEKKGIDLGDAFNGLLAQSKSFADSVGASRSIDINAEEYIAIADKLFQGNSLLERIGMQVQRDARIVGQLEWYGTNPRQQAEAVRGQILAATRGDPDLKAAVGDQNVLNDRFYKEQLLDGVFGKLNSPANQEVAAWGELLRSWPVLAKLNLSAITAQADMVTRAVRQTELLNQSGELGSITGKIVKGFQDNARQFGQGRADAQARATMTGLLNAFDEFQTLRRFEDASSDFTSSSIKGRVTEGIQKLARVNMLDFVTNLNLRASYGSAQSILHSFKDVALKDLHSEMRTLLRSANINDAEWDFIRKFGIEKDKHGNGLITIEALKGVDVSEYKKLFGVKDSKGALSKARTLQSRLNAALRKEAQTQTLMPDIVDQTRITLGTTRGTVTGEIARSAMLFKSFTFALTNRILTPLLQRSKAITQAEYFAAMFTMAMGVKTIQSLLTGRTPPDFREPKNIVGLVSFSMGLPFVDQIVNWVGEDSINTGSVIDLVAGPVLGDIAETGIRGVNTLLDIKNGEDPEIGKQLTKTIGPALPFRNFPLLSIPYNQGYNELMENFNPGYKRRLRKSMDERGQQYIFKD